MAKFIIVGDLHIGRSVSIGKPGIGSSLNSRVIDQFSLLDWVFNQAIENMVDAIIFTGDIFHDIKPNYRYVGLFISFLKNCEEQGIDVHIVVGNHDIKRIGPQYISVLDVISAADLPNVNIYKNTTTIILDGVGITVLPFRNRSALSDVSNVEAISKIQKQLPYEIATIPHGYDKLLVGHLSIDGAIYFGDEYDNFSEELMCPISMFVGYNYVWMGHVHTPQIMSKRPYIAHIGSLDISDFGEVGQTKHIALYDSNIESKFQNIDIPTRKLKHVSIEIPDNEDSTNYVIKEIDKAHIEDSLKDSIIRISIKLPGEDMDNVNRESVEKKIYECGAFFICGFSESRNVIVLPQGKQELADNTISPKAAIKLFAEALDFEQDEEKTKYIEIADLIVDEYYSSLTK